MSSIVQKVTKISDALKHDFVTEYDNVDLVVVFQTIETE